MMRFTVFDRWGRQTGVVSEVIEAVHKDEVNGEDSLTLVVPGTTLAKGQRIVWRDKWGEFHEHVVNEVSDVHADGKLYSNVYCENSAAELYTDYVDDLRPYDTTASEGLRKALSTSRWEVGRVDVEGIASAGLYHLSAREAVAEVQKAWGGELSTTIEVSGAYVSARKVNLTTRRGGGTCRRFEWSRDMASIERTVSADDVVTALYGYGKGLECTDADGNKTGGFSRKLTFSSVNGGKDYVSDEQAKTKWGLPDGKGGVKHAFGKAEFSNCEDPVELKRLTLEELAKRSKPRVSYKANVIDLASAGFDHDDARAGDSVAIVDHGLQERLEGRVLCTERRLVDGSATTITLGNVARSIGSVIGGQAADLDWIKNHAPSWDGAATISDSYINGVIGSMNSAMNASGGYTYYEPGEGVITYDKPKDQNPTMAIQIKGGGFRIANSRKSNGEWDWRTFGTGDGFTADEITAGTIKGGSNYWNLGTGDLLFKQGKIADAKGYTSWNLSTGDFVANNMQANGTFVSNNNYRTMRIANGAIQSLDGSGEVISEIYMDQFGSFLQRSYSAGIHIGSYDKTNPNKAEAVISIMSNGAFIIGSERIVVSKGGWSAEGYDGTVSVGSQSLVFTNGILTGVM